MDWIEIPEKLNHHQGAVVLLGANSWSAHNFLQRLSKPDQPLIWIEISARDQNDPIAQGNRLSQAVERAFGTPLFGLGMPFSYGMSVLQKHQGLLGPFAIGLYGADYSPELVEALLSLYKEQSKLVFCFAKPPKAKKLKNAYNIDLRSGLCPEPILISEEEQTLERQGIFKVLVAQRRWVEAFEWAVLHFPDQAEPVLEKAANLMWAHGECERLYRLLGQLPKPSDNSLVIMRWQFTALLELGREGEMLDDVRAVLAKQQAPELRAMYAIAIYRLNDCEGALREARAAIKMNSSAITSYSLGFLLPVEDPVAAIRVLQDTIRNAEIEDCLYVSGQTALTLCHTFYQLGQYKEIIDWSLWGLRLCEQNGLQNQQLRLALFNEWAFARILNGDTAGLEKELLNQAFYLEKLRPFTQMVFQTTLADLMLVENRNLESLRSYRSLWNRIERRQHYNFLVDSYVRVLLHNNQFDQALSVAEMAVKLTEGLPVVFTRQSHLAYAIVESMLNPDKGVILLKKFIADLSESGSVAVPLYTMAQLYLARVLLILGLQGEAEIHLSELSEKIDVMGYENLQFMAAPNHAFQAVFGHFQQSHYPLELRFLGQQEVRVNGVVTQLRRRFLEILTVLALNPEGMTSEELTLAVYGDKGTAETLRSDLSRLREVIPITPKPYRIQIPVKADFIELQRLISRGKVREALCLYQGSLLPESSAEVVESEREYLDNALRHIVLESQDPEALMGLAEKLKGDLEVWEAAAMCLSKNDPRRVVAQARVQKVAVSWN